MKNNTTLTGMNFELLFDRDIDKNKHYISPGGYEIVNNGKHYRFDFCSFLGSVDKKDKRKLVCTVRDLDEDYGQSTEVTKALLQHSSCEEFYVYTGEGSDETIPTSLGEIVPTQLLNLTFNFSDGSSLQASSRFMESANASLAN